MSASSGTSLAPKEEPQQPFLQPSNEFFASHNELLSTTIVLYLSKSDWLGIANDALDYKKVDKDSVLIITLVFICLGLLNQDAKQTVTKLITANDKEIPPDDHKTQLTPTEKRQQIYTGLCAQHNNLFFNTVNNALNRWQ